MKKKQIDIYPDYPGGGYNPEQQTFILMWNPAISSVTMDYHKYCIRNFDTEPFDWSVYEWEKAHEGDRFFMVRVGEGNTGIVMSGIFTSEPYGADDWNKQRGSRHIHYMDMQPNFIVNPETMPVITTAQLQEAIPDFEWTKGHSGTLLTSNQAKKLETIFRIYLLSVANKADEENLVIDTNDRPKRFKKYLDTQGEHIDTIMPVDVFVEKQLPNVGNWKLYKTANCKVRFHGIENEEVEITALRKGSEMGMLTLLLYNKEEQRYEMLTTYPMHRGTAHKLRITKIQEWKGQMEAIVHAESRELSLAFFATDYYANKDKYVVGSEMEIELAACAYSLSEGERETILDMETSARMRKDMGIEEEYDENGQLKPLVLYNGELVAYLPQDGEYPDNAAFASTVKSVKIISLFGDSFVKATISICHDPEEMYVPLYLRKDMLESIQKGTLLRGALWMQGKISEEKDK